MDDFDAPSSCFISTRTRHRVATISIHDDLLILVRSGTKTVLSHTASTEVKAGTAIVMTRGLQCDVINTPSTNGRYEALVLQFGDQAIQDFQRMFGGEFVRGMTEGCFLVNSSEEFERAVMRAEDALKSADISTQLRNHKVMEVLLMLAERGCILQPRIELLWPERLRRLVIHRPHATWTAKNLASACNTSSSTLRRRLAEQDLTVSAFVRSIRLEAAMLLLQTTNLPIGDIALRCGYASHSRFSAAFKKRYGYTPSYLR